MADDQLDEMNLMDDPAPELASAMPPAPLPTPTPAGRAFPQLYRFFWGGLIVFVGALLPFGPAVMASLFGTDDSAGKSRAYAGMDADARKQLAESLGSGAATPAAPVLDATGPVFPSTQACQTFIGAVFLLFGLMLMGQMYTAIQERKVRLGGVLLMMLPCGWTWLKAVQLCADFDWFKASDLYLVSTFNRLGVELGTGFLLILGGSTYVVLNFLGALFGAATGGKKKPAPAPARSSSRRR